MIRVVKNTPSGLSCLATAFFLPTAVDEDIVGKFDGSGGGLLGNVSSLIGRRHISVPTTTNATMTARASAQRLLLLTRPSHSSSLATRNTLLNPLQVRLISSSQRRFHPELDKHTSHLQSAPRNPDPEKVATLGAHSLPGNQGLSGVDPYHGQPSAIDKAMQLFFFTEIVRGAFVH